MRQAGSWRGRWVWLVGGKPVGAVVLRGVSAGSLGIRILWVSALSGAPAGSGWVRFVELPASACLAGEHRGGDSWALGARRRSMNSAIQSSGPLKLESFGAQSDW